MKKLYTLFILLFFVSYGYGQKLIATGPFTGGSPFIEPNPASKVIKLSETEFVTLAKEKGGLNGRSDYLLEKYNLSLESQYATEIRVGPDEDFVRFFHNGKHLVILAVDHQLYKHKSLLKAYFFDPATGNQVEERVLTESEIGEWADVKYKGAVRETFNNAVYSCLNQNFIVPLEYQYEIKFSPDSSKIITYIFDYSQKSLVAKTKIYDKNFNLLNEGLVPIDKNFTNYGIYPNNRGDVYILNVDRLGRVVVIQYNLSTRDSKLLDIQYSSTNRESLRLQLLNDDEVYVANTSVKDGALVGVMYSKFNFKSNLIDKINFYELSTGLMQTVNTAREVNSSIHNNEDWRNYVITDFIMNKYEKIILVLEKREFIGTDVKHSGESVNHIDKWYEKMGEINTEGIMMFAFNGKDEIIWENFYIKAQRADLNVGLLSTSFALDNSSMGKIRLVYAASDSPSGLLTSLHYVEWDEYSGNREKNLKLENEENISILRSHVLWWEDKLLVVGRKGILGKKTGFNLYELN